MNDAFYEQLVPAKISFKNLALVIVSVLGTIFLSLFLRQYIGNMIVFVIFAAGISIWHFLIPRIRREYEYYLLNYILEITLIMNKETRSNIMEFDIRKAEIVAPVGSSELKNFRPTKKLDFTSGNKNANIYSILIHLDQDLHNILIEPDERMIEQMKVWLNGKMIVK